MSNLALLVLKSVQEAEMSLLKWFSIMSLAYRASQDTSLRSGYWAGMASGTVMLDTPFMGGAVVMAAQ